MGTLEGADKNNSEMLLWQRTGFETRRKGVTTIMVKGTCRNCDTNRDEWRSLQRFIQCLWRKQGYLFQW